MEADEDIKARLERSLHILEPPASHPDAALLRGKRLRVRSRIVGIAVAAGMVVAVVVPLVLLSSLGDRSGETDVGDEHGRLAVGGRIELEPGITDVTFGDGSVWVVGSGGVVTRVDAVTDAVLARIDVPGTGDYGRMAIGEGSVWVTAPELRDDGSRGNLVRIDPSTNEVVATIHVGGPINGLAIGGGWIWVTRPEAGPGTLFRIDPDTDRVMDDHPVGVSPGAPVYADGYVWVASTDGGVSTISKIDPGSGSVVDVLRAPPVQASGDGSLWAVGDDSVVRLDPASGAVQATIPIERASRVFVDGPTAWVLVMPSSSDPDLFYPIAGTAAVTRIDTATNRVVGEPLLLEDLQPLALTARDGLAWVGDFYGGKVTRVVAVPA
jgi:DNA-binding beta-propeller fold protein YncE